MQYSKRARQRRRVQQELISLALSGQTCCFPRGLVSAGLLLLRESARALGNEHPTIAPRERLQSLVCGEVGEPRNLHPSLRFSAPVAACVCVCVYAAFVSAVPTSLLVYGGVRNFGANFLRI